VDRAHRLELKHDKFVEQVGTTVEYAAEHRAQLIRYGAIALAVVAIAVGVYWYMQHEAAVREDALRVAVRTQEAQVGQPGNEFLIGFPTQQAKDAAVQKAWQDLASKYSGTTEGIVAEYYLGINAADKGNTAEAEKHLKTVADSGKTNFASQAKLSLADIYAASGRSKDAEKVLRDLMDHPTIMVSKEEATYKLGELLAKSNPAEARKLLEPLRTSRSAVSRAAITLLSTIPAGK
jgi:predicted negative regulator of RcsB-dependent stress response